MTSWIDPDLEQPGPNYVLLFPDQWRGDCLGKLARDDRETPHNTVVETPYLDHLASEGVTFANAYSAVPSCIGTRASLATGKTPFSCGRMGYSGTSPWPYDTTLMSVLRDAGYSTFATGKTHFYPLQKSLGFEEMRLYHTFQNNGGKGPEGRWTSDYERWLEDKAGSQVYDHVAGLDGNAWVVQPWEHDERLHPSTWTAEAAIELLARRDPTKPFFIQIGWHRPHPPLDPPLHYFERYQDKSLPDVPVGDWAEQYDDPMVDVTGNAGKIPDPALDRARRAYYAHMEHVDDKIGRVLMWLQERDLYDDTYVIFFSDHGEVLGDHHHFRKFNPLEGSAKVPLIVKPPRSELENSRAGAINEKPVTHMDIMPTVLSHADVPIPEEVEGSDLAPLIHGKETEWREYVHGEHSEYTPEAFCGTGMQYLTDGTEKYVWEPATGDEWFFDLEADPFERRNVADEVDLGPWRSRLATRLADRPEGMSDGESLIAGTSTDAVTPEIANADY